MTAQMSKLDSTYGFKRLTGAALGLKCALTFAVVSSSI